MTIHVLLVLHIAVLGYWFGSELVINSTYRHVVRAREMPFAARDRLMDHVMAADQHVRYALLLQLALGFALLFLKAYLPGGQPAAIAAVLTCVTWLVLVEAAHRARKTRAGRMLETLDRWLRYGVMVALAVSGGILLVHPMGMPQWVGWKLIAFAGVIACGVGIRLVLMRYFAAWTAIGKYGSDDAIEQQLIKHYRSATSILVLLWVFILVAVWLSVVKPS